MPERRTLESVPNWVAGLRTTLKRAVVGAGKETAIGSKNLALTWAGDDHADEQRTIARTVLRTLVGTPAAHNRNRRCTSTDRWTPFVEGQVLSQVRAIGERPKDLPLEGAAMTTTKPLPHLLTIEELADHLGVTVRHIRRLIAEKRVPYVKWRRFIRFDPDEIARWLDDARHPEGGHEVR